MPQAARRRSFGKVGERTLRGVSFPSPTAFLRLQTMAPEPFWLRGTKTDKDKLHRCFVWSVSGTSLISRCTEVGLLESHYARRMRAGLC